MDCLQEHQHIYSKAIIKANTLNGAQGAYAFYGKDEYTGAPTNARTGDETRPINYTIRIWRRIA